MASENGSDTSSPTFQLFEVQPYTVLLDQPPSPTVSSRSACYLSIVSQSTHTDTDLGKGVSFG